MEPKPSTLDFLARLEPWQFWGIIGLFAGAGALLRFLVESAQGPCWKRALRVLSSAFWGTLAALLVSDWLTLSPKSLLVLATLLGWVGSEVTLGQLLRAVGKKTDLKLEAPKSPRKKNGRKKPVK
ncbi:MAG: phage holin family protein [Meiothermus sp.]|uniref:hypothetical protein n=1 Tax=Meiothermus sp. TaxID=1955249 RepID=UPI00298F12F9|nr:hypothetical protein [Meiothermus sp.]MCX7601214.1 phage holin family protein [Meiothermus sp.]MDW8425260.1 hypothetical protein [Meiothermus sp.]